MRLFIKKIILFFIVIGSTLCVLELLVRSMNRDTYYSIKNDFMMKNAQVIETLILGTSHTYSGIKPDIFNTATYNLAIPAQGLKLDYELLNGYIDKMPNVKNLIIDISYFSFRTYNFANKNTESFYINYNLYMDPKIDCDFKYNFAISDFGFIKNRLKDFRTYYTEGSKCDSLGWSAGSITTRPDSWSETANGTIMLQTYQKSDAIQKNIEYLTNIIELCKDRSIRLIAVTTPVWNTYYNLLDKEQYMESQNIMYEMQEKYAIEYYNLINDSRFVSDDFYDSDHLSNVGAEKFSKILADTLQL